MSLTATHRTSPFGYTCRKCSRCCKDKRIQLNPYEVARLAANRRVSTGEFMARWTIGGAGTELARDPAGSCVFLGEAGCSVHADRPLVCRLYPLGRHVDCEGREWFTAVERHESSAGSLTRDGTIDDYLQAQGAEPFIGAADLYYSWYVRVHRAAPHATEERSSPSAAAHARASLDMDAAIASYCLSRGLEPPSEIEARLSLHIRILDELLDQSTKEHEHERRRSTERDGERAARSGRVARPLARSGD